MPHELKRDFQRTLEGDLKLLRHHFGQTVERPVIPALFLNPLQCQDTTEEKWERFYDRLESWDRDVMEQEERAERFDAWSGHLQAQVHEASSASKTPFFTISEPGRQSSLLVSTLWPIGHTQQRVTTLIDTGCGTSIITHRLLRAITDKQGKALRPLPVSQPITLVAASGDTMTAEHYANVCFTMGSIEFTHNVYVVDHLPHDVILGMDFMIEKAISIDFDQHLITAPSVNLSMSLSLHPQNHWPLIAAMDTILQPQEHKLIATTTDGDTWPGEIGYVYAGQDDNLPHGLVVWNGIYDNSNNRQIWISNYGIDACCISKGERFAWWIPQSPLDIEPRESKGVTETRSWVPRRVSPLLALAAGGDAQGHLDDWEWQDEHLHLDLSGVPAGVPDPPPHTSIDTLTQIRNDILCKLANVDNTQQPEDIITEINRVKRINDRLILQQQADMDNVPDLPDTLRFDSGYDHLNADQIQLIKQAIKPEAGFFMRSQYPKVIRATTPASIDTGEAAPRSSGYRRLNEAEQKVVDEYVDKLVTADVVEPSNGPWSSPILLVPKKDGGLRAVADLRKVNDCVQRFSYTMPNSQDLIDQLSPGRWYTSLDLGSAFWQLPLAEESRDCTAFMTKTHGLLRWKALPMGFKNSSAYFQREIDLALGSLRVVYIDDICIYSSSTLEDHLEKVAAVLRALRIIGFSGNPAKCKFAQKQVVFLGHRISNGKVEALEDKIKAMVSCRRPQTLTELRAFLGLASYYRRFIKDFSHIAEPLTNLTKQKKEDKGPRVLKCKAATRWRGRLEGRA